jgi:hypothetical protein
MDFLYSHFLLQYTKKLLNFRFYFYLKNVYDPNENLSEKFNQRTFNDA